MKALADQYRKLIAELAKDRPSQAITAPIQARIAELKAEEKRQRIQRFGEDRRR